MSIKAVMVKVYKCHCERCDHRWETREKPLRCAGCKSPYWNIPKEAAVSK